MHNQELETIKDFDEEKAKLAQLHQDNLKESAEKFEVLSNNLKDEFDNMVTQRGVLLEDIDELVNRYQEIDNEISRSELELKYECNERLLDARRLFEDEQTRKKQKLSLLDIMSDDSEDIFKTKE